MVNIEVIWESSSDSLRRTASANWLQPARPVEYNPEPFFILYVLQFGTERES